MKIRLLLPLTLLAVLGLAGTPGAWAQGILRLHEPGAEASTESSIVVRPPIDLSERTWPPEPVPPRRPIPRPPRLPRPIEPAELTNLEINVQINGQLAATTLDQSFRNPNDRTLEGTYLFPLPKDSAVQDLSLFIDGKPVKCEVLEAGKARHIYEEIVRSSRDPALLEYIGRDLVQLRIFPIDAGQVRRVRFKYTQVLSHEFGLTQYAYPLAARNQAEMSIGQFTLSGSIESDAPIATVYSPTHDLEFVHKSERTIRFAFEEENHRPAQDLKIFFGTSEQDLGASLVTYREPGEKGYFLLMVAPRQGLDEEEKVLAKDVTFVFDTSGSMSGEKIEQAREALKFCLGALRAQDRFRVVRFSTEAEALSDALRPATPPNTAEAIRLVEKFEATGGTAVDAALALALDAPSDPERPHLIVFLTDGKPTVGETAVPKILDNVGSKNARRARIFSFGVGFEVNTNLLDQLSDDNGGVCEYVTPREDIEVQVSNFFRKVSSPVLTDLEVDYGDTSVADAYPRQLPDLFAGSQIALVGRYSGSGAQTVVVRGKVASEGREARRVFEYPLHFPEENDAGDFLPRLWAVRRVGYLVAEIRKNGEDPELRDEIVRLGKRYAIATPYTSLLVTEDEAIQPSRGVGILPDSDGKKAPPRGMPMFRGAPMESLAEPSMRLEPSAARGANDEMETAAPRPAAAPADSARAASALSATSGEAAVQISQDIRKMKESLRASSDLDAGQTARQVAGRTFYRREGVWTDSEYKEGEKAKEIAYGSDAYFDLMAKGGDIGKFLALGTRVVFRFEGKWYRIVDAR